MPNATHWSQRAYGDDIWYARRDGEEWPDFGTITITPDTPAAEWLCESSVGGDGVRCVLGNVIGLAGFGKSRLERYVQLADDEQWLRVTFEGWQYRRDLTAAQRSVARRLDAARGLGQPMVLFAPLVVSLNTNGPGWFRTPAVAHGGQGLATASGKPSRRSKPDTRNHHGSRRARSMKAAAEAYKASL